MLGRQSHGGALWRPRLSDDRAFAVAGGKQIDTPPVLLALREQRARGGREWLRAPEDVALAANDDTDIKHRQLDASL